MSVEIVDVPVICVRCRQTFDTLQLTVERGQQPKPIYAVCDFCRTTAKTFTRFSSADLPATRSHQAFA